MKKFKKNWQIQKNWQLIFPLIGIIGLFYSAYKLAFLIITKFHIVFTPLIILVLFYLLLKFFLFLFKLLEKKWIVTYRWEIIRIFIVFAITGSSSVLIGKPIIALLGITKENLNPFVYWFLYIIIGLIFYQILLVFFGWIFGQFQFFWEFEKKMLRRFGLKRFIN
jgi:hypothetical protein